LSPFEVIVFGLNDAVPHYGWGPSPTAGCGSVKSMQEDTDDLGIACRRALVMR